MKVETFFRLYSILEKSLEKEFNKSKYNEMKVRKKSGYRIDLKLRLSAAIRYFAGGDPLDIMVSHYISHSSVYTSVWGVVDAVNNSEKLKFSSSNHEKQIEISNSFKRMSGAFFDNVVGCIDGILIWTTKPSRKECRELKCI